MTFKDEVSKAIIPYILTAEQNGGDYRPLRDYIVDLVRAERARVLRDAAARFERCGCLDDDVNAERLRRWADLEGRG